MEFGRQFSGNTNTLAGNVPPKADLGDLRGLSGGLSGVNTSSMINGGEFDGAKAYKDSKVCNMLTMQEFHRRFHEETGITFASLYPGCIATTGLFRYHIPLFRTLFPPFQKYITKGYVSEEESGKRLAQVMGTFFSFALLVFCLNSERRRIGAGGGGSEFEQVGSVLELEQGVGVVPEPAVGGGE